jgi:glycine oxidase
MSGIAASTPVWFDQLDDRERAALRPGVPDGLDRRPDVLVVGGGVQGLAVAMACRARGLGRVLLIERDGLASGPSGSAAGVLCPDAHLDVEGPAFVAFARASLARYEALAQEAGAELRLRWLDWLMVGPGAAQSSVAALPAVQRLDAGDVRRLVPGLALDEPGLLLPRGEAHLNPQRLAAVLAARGGAVATGVEYLGMRAAGGRVEAVNTSLGDLHPGAVVLATGLAPAGVLPLAQHRVKGHLAATAPVGTPLPVALTGAGWGMTPLEGGRLLIGGDQAPDDGSPDVDEAMIRGFRADLDRLLPGVAGEFTHAWRCARPAIADRLPVIDRAPGLDNVWLTAGHFTTGLLLAPAAGQALATWIESGSAPQGIDPFRLGAT